MERTKKGDEVLRWRKTGGGSFRMAGGKIIKPGQVFNARPDEIPKSFRDVCIPLDKLPPEGDDAPLEVASTDYTYEKRGESNWYDVFGPDGKKLNEKALTRVKALEFIEALK